MRTLTKSEMWDAILAFNAQAAALWNEGKLEEFCDRYAFYATYVSKETGYLRSRAAILAHYEQAYPDRSRMGTLVVTTQELRFPLHDEQHVSMAVGVLKWSVHAPDNTIPEEGWSMVTYALRHEAEIEVVQDCTV